MGLGDRTIGIGNGDNPPLCIVFVASQQVESGRVADGDAGCVNIALRIGSAGEDTAGAVVTGGNFMAIGIGAEDGAPGAIIGVGGGKHALCIGYRFEIAVFVVDVVGAVACGIGHG